MDSTKGLNSSLVYESPRVNLFEVLTSRLKDSVQWEVFHTSRMKCKENAAILYCDSDYDKQQQAPNDTLMRKTLLRHQFCHTYLPEWILIC